MGIVACCLLGEFVTFMSALVKNPVPNCADMLYVAFDPDESVPCNSFKDTLGSLFTVIAVLMSRLSFWEKQTRVY